MRRIKAVSLTIPAVTGPHTSLGAKLTLTQDRVRLVNFTDAGMPENYDAGDPIHSDARFAVGYGGTTAIATSHGRSDAGVFNLDFRDDRYLPFEGAGAISDWRLDLPNAVRQFDYDTISDVEIQIQYTARDGGAQMRGIVDARLATLLKNALLEAGNAGMLTLPLSGRAAFPVSLEKLLYPATGEEGQPVEVPIVLERFPYAVRQLGPRVKSVRAVFVLKDGATGVFTISSLLELTDPTPTTVTAGLHATNFDATFTVSTVSVTDDPWLFGLGATTTIDKPEEIKDLILLVDIDLP
jgi:hypothetical protein